MKCVSLLGLALNMVGAALMYFNTPYPSKRPKGTAGPDQISQNANWLFIGRHKERKQLTFIKWGFGLLMLGSFLQLISSIF